MSVRQAGQRGRKKRYPHWRPEEDEKLLQLRPQGRNFRWFAIESLFPGRTAKQIRERWVNQLDPSVSHGQWTKDEDWRLFLCCAAYGGRWSVFRQHFPHRTDNQLKNRWNSGLQPHKAELRAKLLQLMEGGGAVGGSPPFEDLLIPQLAKTALSCQDVNKEASLSSESTRCGVKGDSREGISAHLGSGFHEVAGRRVDDSGDDFTEKGGQNFWQQTDVCLSSENHSLRSFT